jgi:hypothetical protein
MRCQRGGALLCACHNASAGCLLDFVIGVVQSLAENLHTEATPRNGTFQLSPSRDQLPTCPSLGLLTQVQSSSDAER